MNTIFNKTTISRKEHYCNGCLTKWPKGTEFDTSTITDSGAIWTWRECPICMEIRKQEDFESIEYNDDGINEGDFRNYERFNEIKNQVMKKEGRCK